MWSSWGALNSLRSAWLIAHEPTLVFNHFLFDIIRFVSLPRFNECVQDVCLYFLELLKLAEEVVECSSCSSRVIRYDVTLKYVPLTFPHIVADQSVSVEIETTSDPLSFSPLSTMSEEHGHSVIIVYCSPVDSSVSRQGSLLEAMWTLQDNKSDHWAVCSPAPVWTVFSRIFIIFDPTPTVL